VATLVEDRLYVLAAGSFQLDLPQRKSVDIEQDVRPAVLTANDDREPVDREELVVRHDVEVHKPCVFTAFLAVLILVGDGYAREKQLVEAR
jgi:hypothetical protein